MARKIAVSVTLDAKVIEYIESQRTEEDSFSAALNRVVKSIATQPQAAPKLELATA